MSMHPSLWQASVLFLESDQFEFYQLDYLLVHLIWPLLLSGLFAIPFVLIVYLSDVIATTTLKKQQQQKTTAIAKAITMHAQLFSIIYFSVKPV